ncbi:phage tail protein [Methylosinus sporium]|uniref:Phage tail protein n=1 Tax=Methylosinus sporium TaxID=428 RepID=A0A549T092_METSR|nr:MULTISPECIES: tail fiber protein [Methylosinus]MBU3886947.1 tail fiber protein [Methylosinus sp. KRF6]TRL35302.1 phage tail protein [Methylosinus sporium]
MSEPFIGMIVAFAGNFAPRGWALCQGQLLSIAQHTALFSILGTTYGGNGQTNFALPDLRGRAIVGQGQGPGLGFYALGEIAGVESTTLTTSQMPAHTHLVSAQATAASTPSPAGAVPAELGAGKNATNLYGPPTPATAVAMAPSMISPTGGNQPVSVLSPFTVINYIIALEGVFPSPA